MSIRIHKIYTRGGDKGKTALGQRARVEKSHPVIHLGGELDELNSHIGMLIAQCNGTSIEDQIKNYYTPIQNRIFDLGSLLHRGESNDEHRSIVKNETLLMEEQIDLITEKTPELTSFILQGGSIQSCQAHIARTVCRRCERNWSAIPKEDFHFPEGLAYINRLSDHLFAISRLINIELKTPEVLWEPIKA